MPSISSANKSQKILAIPTHIITGFLGVGKTSTILNLLANKPSNEHWAVLVNEFGEIGVDGSLLSGQYSEEQGVFISEVPGGCMCCTAGVPMQITLNQLLKRAKPDRLFIEPTGLGHPKEVLQALSTPHYKDVLHLQKTLTLVDARQLTDERYTSHDIFNQQIAIADVIVGNKADLYQVADKENLNKYSKKHGKANAQILFAQQGELLSSTKQSDDKLATPITETLIHLLRNTESAAIPKPIAKLGLIKGFSQNTIEVSNANIVAQPHSITNNSIDNKDKAFESIGWCFPKTTVFNYKKLYNLLQSIEAQRLKAVFYTDQGIFGYNLNEEKAKSTGDTEKNTEGKIEYILTEVTLHSALDSRIEVIIHQLNTSPQLKQSMQNQQENDIKEALMLCIISEKI
ncbi:GTP-binding protein [Colwellia sp. E2M01]|uniref:CobW family GTP-binding protein n=1 Tax=Colwellia sp. E2M01 TaxID=2841561 RepID=UPI001C0994FB|nr:GTP-binding protein [Colwellia sp. E2M01]MBU2872175.1 GTP-binding protein [Colwellia sp. E2M01]